MTDQPQIIATIDDLAKVVTVENVDRLAADLYLFLNVVAKHKEQNPENAREITWNSFNWKDDGKVGVNEIIIDAKLEEEWLSHLL